MNTRLSYRRIFFGLVTGAALAACGLFAQSLSPVPESIQKIFRRSCGVVGCHQGQYPKMALNFDTAEGVAATIGAASLGRPESKLIDPNDPDKSYILMKLRGDRAIAGRRMPNGKDPLKPEEIQAIRDWIAGLKSKDLDSDQDSPAPAPKKPLFPVPAFWGRTLANLPTALPIDKGRVLFRVSHRFFNPIRGGIKDFYGLDSPAQVLFGFGFGISDRLGAMISRTNIDQDVELGLSWLALSQGGNGRLPFSAALNVSANVTTLAREGRSLLDAGNVGFNVALSLVHQLSGRVSLMLVPSYGTNTTHGDPTIQGTLGLGLGGRVMVFEDLSLIAEWMPVLSGHAAETDGWSVGIEKKIGGHVFQAFILNSHGLTTDQVVPGGDLRADVRLGFNIYRTF